MANQRQLELILKTSKQGQALEGATKDLKGLKGGFKDAFGELTGVSIGAAGAIAAVTGALKFSIGAAMEAEKIQADLNATLASTKGAAGLSADEINSMAAELSNLTGIEDDSIVSAQAMLLTFTNIGKDVFPQATEAMLNMSTKFGGLESASVQLGKALNDPIAGVTALKKVGVSLTDEQEKQIKKFMELGDVASAQKVILKELETEFGGLARAMGGTTEGSINKLKNSLGNLAEAVGGKLAPFLAQAADALNVLITANDKVTESIKEHDQELLESGATYEWYIAEMVRVEYARQQQFLSTEEVIEILKREGTSLEITAERYGAKTQSVYEAAQAQYQLNRAIIAGEAPIKAQSAAWNAMVKEMEINSGKYGATAEQVDLLRSSMGELTTAALYQKAILGMDAEAALQLGLDLGLVSGASYDAQKKIMDWQKELAQTNNIDLYTERVKGLVGWWAKFDSKKVTLEVITKGIPDPYDNPGGGSGGGGGFYTPVPKINPGAGDGGKGAELRAAMMMAGGSTTNINFSGPVNMTSQQDITNLANQITANLSRRGRY